MTIDNYKGVCNNDVTIKLGECIEVEVFINACQGSLTCIKADNCDD